MSGIYDYKLPKADGTELDLADFSGKVILFVNTATGCGFTPHYEPIQKMYEDFHDRGFEVVDVPCNQFADQTPGTDDEIHEFCTLKYHTTFPQMKKSDVNGPNALPVFEFLKSQQGFKGFGHGPMALLMRKIKKKADKDYKNNPDIKWNFTKFVVDRDGNVVKRFEPTEDMKAVREYVEGLL